MQSPWRKTVKKHWEKYRKREPIPFFPLANPQTNINRFPASIVLCICFVLLLLLFLSLLSPIFSHVFYIGKRNQSSIFCSSCSTATSLLNLFVVVVCLFSLWRTHCFPLLSGYVVGQKASRGNAEGARDSCTALLCALLLFLPFFFVVFLSQTRILGARWVCAMTELFAGVGCIVGPV